MESIGEKIAYLKGLAEGLKVDESTSEGKIIKGILEVLADLSASVSDMEDDMFEMQEVIDEIDEDLAEVEDEIYDECCDCEDEDDVDFYELNCPNCKEKIYIDEDMLEDEELICPNCDEKIELDFDDTCGCCDCGCEEE